MVSYRLLLFIPAILLLVSSCRPARQAVVPSVGEPNAAAYIEKYKDIAVSEMKRTGVPASITLAQGMIESDFGRSNLARQANNHFGIKCHSDWKGSTIRHHDDRRNECFRKYPRAEDSFYDHSDFLRKGTRYSFLFDLDIADYKGWARGLKKAGYATNPDYANMLIRKIEEHSLNYYDQIKPSDQKLAARQKVAEKLAPAPEPARIADTVPAEISEPVVKAPVSGIMENNRVRYIIAGEGESREMIERQYNMLKWELARYNELSDDFIPVPGQMLYLQPKRDRAEPGKETHVTGEGETMYNISQLYGIKVSKLYEMNRMREGEEPLPGTRLLLRSMKPVSGNLN